MCIHCNAGVKWTDQQGYLPGFGLVWYCPTAISNILSFANISDRFGVVFDNSTADQFTVTMEDGIVLVLGRSKAGLYFHDTAITKHAAVLVNTIQDNESRYTNAEVSRAKGARNLQTSIGCPSTRNFIDIVNNNLVPNCPVTKRDIMAAEDIFGPNLGSLKGKTDFHNLAERCPRSV